MSLVFGVKIYLQDKASPVAEDTDIGLYNVAGDNSQFRWLQNSVSGVTTWKERMIVEKGLRPLKLNIDLSQKGNASYPGAGEVVVRNDAKLWQTVQALGVDFDGLKAEVYLFLGASPWRIRTYECGEPTFDSRELKIPLRGMQETRVANVMNVVTSVQFPHATRETLGRDLPATFGKLYPNFDAAGAMLRSSMARFVRASNEQAETGYTNAALTDEGSRPEMRVFPVTVYTSYIQFIIRVDGTSKAGVVYPKNMHVIAVAGDGEGQIRKVASYSKSGAGEIQVTLETALYEAFSTVTATRTWVKFVDAYKDFYCDHWVCKGFLDHLGADAPVSPELYAYVEDVLKRIADYGYKFKNVGVGNNQVSVDPKHMDGDLDTINSFLIKPATSLALEGNYPITAWSHGDATWDGLFAGATKYADGLFLSTLLNVSTYAVNSNSLSDAANAYDRDSLTYAARAITASIGYSDVGYFRYINIVKFNLPELPRDVNPSNIYVLVKLKSTNSAAANPGMVLVLRRFRYNMPKDSTADKAFVALAGVEVEANDLPGFYCSDAPADYDENFYATSDGDALLRGYASFELTGVSGDEYRAYYEGAIIFYNQVDSPGSVPGSVDLDDSLKIYEVGVAFKLADQSVSDALYLPAAGRTFAYTWQGRKTAGDLVEKPADLLEHVCRLQNYRDTCPTPVSGWGLQYADEPLIGTSGWGSFDDPDLAAARDYCAAAQLTSRDEGFTDKLKQRICRDFALANWQDKDGKERVVALPSSAQAPVYTVTMRDVVDRNRISVVQKRRDNVYSEPLVRYQKNPATGEYEKLLAVRNSSSTYYLPSHVDGVENAAEAEALWRTAHSLALKSHRAAEPPSDLTDLTFANGPGGYTIAYNYLKHWLDWQLATEEILFPLHVTTCVSWEECTPINVAFSHQTNGAVRRALVEEISLDPNPPYEAMIKAITYA